MRPCAFCHKPFLPTALPPAKEAITCPSCVKKYYSGGEPDTETLTRSGASTAASRSRRTAKPKDREKDEEQPIGQPESDPASVKAMDALYVEPDEELHHHGEDD